MQVPFNLPGELSDRVLSQRDLSEYDLKKRWALRPPDEFPSPCARSWGFDRFGLWQAFCVESVCFKMRYITPGTFLMGSPRGEPERGNDEQQHVVTLTQGFWLSETAVSQSLWLAIMKENPSVFSPDNNTEYTLEHPVENVSWQDCQQFIAKLNEFLSLDSISLPTEAQWEYACRAGTETPFYTGVQLTTEQANYDGNYPYNGGTKGIYFEHTLPVKTFYPNPWGLYQMSGNVWEWCLDGAREYSSDAVKDPIGSLDTDVRVLRGGSWYDRAGNCRSAYRSAYDSAYRLGSRGFRLAMVQHRPENKASKERRWSAPAERGGDNEAGVVNVETKSKLGDMLLDLRPKPRR